MKAAYGTASQSEPFTTSSCFIILLGNFMGKLLMVNMKEEIIKATYMLFI